MSVAGGPRPCQRRTEHDELSRLTGQNILEILLPHVVLPSYEFRGWGLGDILGDPGVPRWLLGDWTGVAREELRGATCGLPDLLGRPSSEAMEAAELRLGGHGMPKYLLVESRDLPEKND